MKKNKTVWISGASRGIGRACAVEFSNLGFDLILVGRSAKDLKKTAALCNSSCEVVELDLVDFDKVESHFREIKKIDIAVNNAGFEGKWREIGEMSLKDYDQVMNINLKSMWFCLKNQIHIMKNKKRGGTIVNLASIAGIKVFPNESLYCTSKYGVIGLTRSLALEQIKNQIRINCVSPGGVDTDMLSRNMDLNLAAQAHPVGRIATPKEIARAVVWLSSVDSEFLVGHNLVVDGGITL